MKKTAHQIKKILKKRAKNGIELNIIKQKLIVLTRNQSAHESHAIKLMSKPKGTT